MKGMHSTRRAIAILSATALTLTLLAAFAVRVHARMQDDSRPGGPPGAPPSTTPMAPKPIALEELPTPYCRGCSWNSEAPLEFQVDLDLLAPLGHGSKNAAMWFRQFATDGARSISAGLEPYKKRRIDVSIAGVEWTVLPGDDPLLLEAEPWVDQATCRFYPDVWDVTGMDTSIPNLLFMLDLARAWVVRGKLADDPDLAAEDFRRAIRLGRLLRQDDVTIIQDLVAIAAIRIGAEALYEFAREQGDGATMVVATLVLTDKDAMRLQTAQRFTVFEPGVQVEGVDSGELSLRINDEELDSIVRLTGELAERRFRFEGLNALLLVKHLGSPGQQETAATALAELAKDPDETFSGLAASYRDTQMSETDLREWVKSWQ